LIASYSEPKSSRCSCTNRTALARGLLVVLLRHGSHLPNQEGVSNIEFRK
jgi:hypothetical protein